MTWNELDTKAQRKALILGGLVALALIILIWPTSRANPHPQLRPKPSPTAKAVPVHVAAPPQLDPLHNAFGKWQGAETLPNRGLCSISLELSPENTPNAFSAATTLGCFRAVVPTNKDPLGFVENSRRALNPTSASFSGTVEGGAIVLRATDNIGVSQALEGCDMVSMTLKPFGESRLSVKWQESGKGACTGGEMLLMRAR